MKIRRAVAAAAFLLSGSPLLFAESVPQLPPPQWDAAGTPIAPPPPGLTTISLPTAEAASDFAAQDFHFTRPTPPAIPEHYRPTPPPGDSFAGQLLWALSSTVAGRTEDDIDDLPKVAEQLSRGGPRSFSVGSMPHRQLGEYTEDGDGPPRVLLSSRLEDLYDRGVPAECLAAVLAHELDHAQARASGAQISDLQMEERAFRREAAYLNAVGEDRITKLLDGALSDGDPDRIELYTDYLSIIAGDRKGTLTDSILHAYGDLH